MKNKISRNDLTIEETLFFRKLEKAFLSRCSHFGYNEIKTSTIQPLHIFTESNAISPSKLKEAYSFLDWNGWSGERVALKLDSTTCVARLYGEKLYSIAPEQKLCYVENHFAWGDSTNEISERWQFGIENIGTKKIHSDVEVIYMAWDILQSTGLKNISLHLSYPFIVNQLRELYGSKFEDFLRLKGDSSNYLKNLKSSSKDKKALDAFENFEIICKHLDKLNCKYEIDFSLSGDLEYYTGVQFKILHTPGKKSKRNILCAGGRYDNLIGKVSESVPAAGFALYVRNIIDHISTEIDKQQSTYIYIPNTTGYNLKIGQNLCDRLSRIGFAAQIVFSPVEDYEHLDLIIEVDKKFNDGYKVRHSKKIDKPLLIELLGELNDR
ncbi:Histidyl-tRNA synthetase [Candidatus Magnetomoraceae bacterium gMMP-1]